ncbi:hypothetical protein BLNAU_10727 [Blattamonas nauphoetae]|uniref:Right handed beta helix domain-containing protein n=1 Tax=Blattamonas nauphoetae TaxID=2049346 RepID=A0ABQ9XRQ0_9EUKA|nr:hypothetical protein BLNAU_10727 [Blattamonas nauphoetae]
MLGVSLSLFADKHDEHTLAVEISSFVLICDSASDWGSSLLSNSSFSSCFTNEAPAPVGRPTQDSSKTIQEHTDSTRLVRDDLSESFADLEVWVISCTFSGLASEFYGSAILIDTFDTAVVITDSSFENCHSTGFFSDGGAITLRRNTPPAAGSKFSLTLFHCDFSNNTAGSTGGHLFVQNYSPVTVAQCTFKDSRSSTDTPLNQMNSIHFIFDDDCRFDNTTISSNEGSRVGGICFDQGLETGKIVLTDVLFKDNECSSSYLRSLLTDCMFQNDIGVANNRFFDCFSTSALPRCGTNFADTLFPDFIGPTIKSVSQTKQKNEKGDGYEVALSFVGVFTGTNRKYDVTLEAADGTRLVAKKVSFNKTVGTATFTLGNPSVPGITPFSSYKIVSVEKSVIESTSNEFDVGEGEEPDWKWWHHTSESRADSMVGLSFTTLQGPTLTDINAGLNPSNVDEAIVVLSIFDALVGSFTLFVYDVLDPLKQEISIGPFSISSTSTTSSHIVPLHPSGILLYEKTYIVASISSSTTTVTHGYRYFSVPARPPLTKAAFLFATSSHTSFNIRIEGADLPQDKVYEVTLDGFDTPIEVTFTTTTFGLSEELALGWTDSLNFDTAYPLVSLIHKETTHSLPCSHLTLQTDPRPDPLELFANDSVHSDPKFCGAKERPCSSLDVAWLIVEAYSAQTVSLVVIKEASLSSPISIGVAQDVIVKQHLLTPTLVIPSTASLGDSTGFISVSGTLEMREVNIDIQAEALSFVLFDVEEGKLVLKDVQISGVLSSSDLLDGIAGLCAWETGLIKLHNAKMETHSCEFSSIEMGEIWMESSNLSLISTQILSNGARFSSFPSAQQDVMCKSGTISILPSASDTTEDHWISSSSECSVTLNGSELKWPHFVASLDATNCTSTQSKKKDSFSVSIVGTKLIPCDLKLEVGFVERDSSETVDRIVLTVVSLVESEMLERKERSSAQKLTPLARSCHRRFCSPPPRPARHCRCCDLPSNEEIVQIRVV